MGNLCCKEKINQESSLNNDYGQKQVNATYEKRLVNSQKTNFKSDDFKINNNNETSQPETISCNENKSWEQQLKDKDFIMLIGCQGVGKSSLFNQMKLQEIQQPNNLSCTILYDDLTQTDSRQQDLRSEQFIEGMLESKYVIVDTPSLQLQDDIDVREQVIKKYQIYFHQREHISHFGIVVKFERTDLMKSKVIQVLKFMRKFQDLISIIVVNMELSENEEEDKKNLEKCFKQMEIQAIIFINKNKGHQDILEQIKKIQLKKTYIDLKDTIFEEISIVDMEKINSNLKALFNEQNIRN